MRFSLSQIQAQLFSTTHSLREYRIVIKDHDVGTIAWNVRSGEFVVVIRNRGSFRYINQFILEDHDEHAARKVRDHIGREGALSIIAGM